MVLQASVRPESHHRRKQQMLFAAGFINVDVCFAYQKREQISNHLSISSCLIHLTWQGGRSWCSQSKTATHCYHHCWALRLIPWLVPSICIQHQVILWCKNGPYMLWPNWYGSRGPIQLQDLLAFVTHMPGVIWRAAELLQLSSCFTFPETQTTGKLLLLLSSIRRAYRKCCCFGFVLVVFV